MRLAALCPTYGRPQLVQNALACFLSQTHSRDDRLLVVLDDGGNIATQRGDDWLVESTTVRYPSMKAKYDRLVQIANEWGADGYVVWDDDDIYLPRHLEAHAWALSTHKFSYPHEVWSEGGGSLQRERTGGNLHGSIAVGRELYEKIGGWPETREAAFDLQFIAKLLAYAQPGRPDSLFGPTYVFRWANTGYRHYQNYCTGGHQDTTVYDRIVKATEERIEVLTPLMDEHTEFLFRTLVK